MSILVTGAKGQLGGELCCQLGRAATGVDIDVLDLTNRTAVIQYVATVKPTAVINCAAYTQVDRAETEPEACRAVNAKAVDHLVEACRAVDCPLVQISTDYVFGTVPSPLRPWREDDLPAPRGVYAQTKLDGERAAARLTKHLIVRTCGLYARPSDPRAVNFVRTMLRLGSTRSELRVVNDQCCTPTYVPHLAAAIMSLLDLAAARQAWGTYHVTNTGSTTWFDFAVEIFRLAGMPISVQPITAVEYGAAAPRPAYSVLDTTTYHALGGPAMPSWQRAIAQYFEEARQ